MPFDEDSPYVVGAIDIYGIKAKAFMRCTNLMAPGKDQMYGEVWETRNAVWELWMKVHGEVINAVIKATIENLPPLA